MLTQWRQRWSARREDAAVARKPIRDDLWKRTLQRYPFLRRRAPADAAALRRMTSLFLDRKQFDAAPGVRLTDDVAVAVAAQACLPVLHLGLAAYDGFVGIVLHPDAVVARRTVTDDDGVVHEYDEVLSGEAMEGGPVMLSWRDVRSAGRSAADAYNVVIHEFAHVLDMADGVANGVPRLPAELPAAEWQAALTAEYQNFVARVQAGAETALDPYGAEAPEEFFAVASEAFFVSPQAMKAEHPALYGVFVRFYRQDPVEELP
ncbi:MAG: zinc-dependent peptidase [Chitinophagaceae bacterium]|nr:zinc-dependent peptidase [Rubrivivax sp.]